VRALQPLPTIGEGPTALVQCASNGRLPEFIGEKVEEIKKNKNLKIEN